jgi:hypothetical protein
LLLRKSRPIQERIVFRDTDAQREREKERGKEIISLSNSPEGLVECYLERILENFKDFSAGCRRLRLSQPT